MRVMTQYVCIIGEAHVARHVSRISLLSGILHQQVGIYYCLLTLPVNRCTWENQAPIYMKKNCPVTNHFFAIKVKGTQCKESDMPPLAS